jgi:hypothetical protein
VLFPTKRHRGPIDGKVYVVHDRTLVDHSRPCAGRATHFIDHLFYDQLDGGPSALVMDDADVF